MGFRKAGEQKLGGKFLVFGDTGSGKSFFLLTFPDIGAADSESGLAHYENKPITIAGKEYNNLKFVDNTADIDELESDLDDLTAGVYDDEIRTFGIDSETKFYNSMQVGAMTVEERRARKTGGDVDDSTVSQRQWGRIKLLNMKLQQAKIDLSARGTHIVSIAQEADLRDKKDTDKIIGEKPDMHKSVPYDYDTVLRFYKEVDKKTGGTRFYTRVIKDRTMVTKVGDIIENCTYDIWADYYKGKSKLESANTSYRKDLDTTTANMVDKADKVDKMITEWKQIMKALKESGSTDKISKINKKLKSLKIDVKNMNLCDFKVISELFEYSREISD